MMRPCTQLSDEPRLFSRASRRTARKIQPGTLRKGGSPAIWAAVERQSHRYENDLGKAWHGGVNAPPETWISPPASHLRDFCLPSDLTAARPPPATNSLRQKREGFGVGAGPGPHRTRCPAPHWRRTAGRNAARCHETVRTTGRARWLRAHGTTIAALAIRTSHLCQPMNNRFPIHPPHVASGYPV